MTTYSLTATTFIQRSDGAFIPPDPRNTDYAEYLTWVSKGNTPTPYVAPPAQVPGTVTPFQAKAALLQSGLLDTVKAAIASAPPLVQLAWTDATEFTRDSPTIAALSAQLGLTSEQVDDLFIAASAIEA